MIALLRVDNRLVHGQILETWVPRLRVRRLVVADDEAARTPLARAALTLALPPDLPTDIVPLASVDWVALAAAPEPMLVLLRDVGDLARAVAAGLTPALAPRVNLGNIHYRAGRRPVTPSVFLDRSDLDTVLAAEAQGFAVEARAIPSDPPAGARDLEQRYNLAAKG